uniref:GTP-binding protein n=1 Tax=Caenorhabditis tropicalis TaxID=1561998 RepID=A0A1I7UXU7_9PELO
MNRSKSVGRRDAKPRGERRQNKVTVAVLGAERVGKSAMVSQFLWHKFVEDYRPTVEEFNWIEYEIEEGRVLMVQIIDSSGSRDFIGMKNLYIGTADAFLVVFASDDASSLEEALITVADIHARRGKSVPILLVANKTDQPCLSCCASKSDMECCALKEEEVKACFHEILLRTRPNLNIQGFELRKRRQSMPSSRGYSGVEPKDIEKIKSARKQQKDHCIIS